MNNFIKFPSIERFKHVYKEVRARAEFVSKDDAGVVFDASKPKPKITFTSTIKIHGINVGVSLDRQGNFTVQSRSRIVSPDDDSYGFYSWVTQPERQAFLTNYLTTCLADNDAVIVFGEFAGKGIQKWVAVSQVEKHFYPFNVATVKNDIVHYLPLYELNSLENRAINILPITLFPMQEFIIDFNATDLNLVLDEIQQLCDAVECQCPIGQYHQVNGIGEGIVLCSEDFTYRFKVKGDEHATAKRQLAINSQDEQFDGIKDFVATVVSEPRLQQGMSYLQENNIAINKQHIPQYVEWIWQDVLKEEHDNIKAKQFEIKQLRKLVTNTAVKYFNQCVK